MPAKQKTTSGSVAGKKKTATRKKKATSSKIKDGVWKHGGSAANRTWLNSVSGIEVAMKTLEARKVVASTTQYDEMDPKVRDRALKGIVQQQRGVASNVPGV